MDKIVGREVELHFFPPLSHHVHFVNPVKAKKGARQRAVLQAEKKRVV